MRSGCSSWLRPVHPHARGEMGRDRFSCLALLGSSPRTWGNGERGEAVSDSHLFIPTHVGKWHRFHPRPGSRTVHPHARGEMGSSSNAREAITGSSPRTWGNEEPGAAVFDWCRFIPTHVGKWESAAWRKRTHSVHPHARGEMACLSRGEFWYPGSSPRTWGNVRQRQVLVLRPRFIPTHVGKWA